MKQLPANRSSSPPGTPLLYRFVFERALVRLFVVVLVCSFLLQTVERAYANESPPEPAPNLPVTITDEAVATIQQEFSTRAESPAEVVSGEATAPADEPSPDVSPPPDTPIATEEDPTPVPPDAGVLDVPASGEVEPPTDTTNLPVATSTEQTGTTTATSTDPTTPTLTVESDQMIQFSKDNCLAVEDGSFYCQLATTTVPAADEQGLFSLPDSDGDLEIYLKNNDGLQQITYNTVDDASPYYDPASDSLVWHRLVDERYQIVVYDMASGEERQLTDTSTNNMEPFRADNIIVWQYWDNDAWQIMLYDGETATQLTNTSEHNLAPVIRNNLVVWHRVQYNEKTIEVYDLNSKAFMTIRDDNGGTISNPRMVLVYDAAMENGDIETRGYDLVTGEITSFEAEPAPLPDEIPSPDTTGETRALLSTKSPTEEDGLEAAANPDGNASSTPPDLELNLATSTEVIATTTSLTLDLTETTVITEVVSEPVAAIPDLVVTPFTPDASPIDIPVVE
jgi:hypothetical protein